MNVALNIGASRQEIIEMLINLAPYSGYATTQ
ncbi:hypothetical protein [Bordetella tumbae]